MHGIIFIIEFYIIVTYFFHLMYLRSFSQCHAAFGKPITELQTGIIWSQRSRK